MSKLELLTNRRIPVGFVGIVPNTSTQLNVEIDDVPQKFKPGLYTYESETGEVYLYQTLDGEKFNMCYSWAPKLFPVELFMKLLVKKLRPLGECVEGRFSLLETPLGFTEGVIWDEDEFSYYQYDYENSCQYLHYVSCTDSSLTIALLAGKKVLFQTANLGPNTTRKIFETTQELEDFFPGWGLQMWSILEPHHDDMFCVVPLVSLMPESVEVEIVY